MTEGLDRTSITEIAGYRLQLTLVDLIDLTLQAQHVRWNLIDEGALRAQLDDFDALTRAAADAVAAGLRRVGVAPDGRISTAYQDLLFAPLPDGPLETGAAVAAFAHRLTQFGARLLESHELLEEADPESAEVLAALNDEITAWTNRFGSDA